MSANPSAIPVPRATIYNGRFWVAFVANVLLVAANALTFRFAEFVNFLGGSEEVTGQIISVGLIGSLFWRTFLGSAIDRFGVRRLWCLSGAVYLLGCILIVMSSSVSWNLYLARILYVVGLTSMFSCSMSYIQSLAPAGRRTEIIGTFGSSGFLGMILGAQIGDLIFAVIPDSRWLYEVLFGLTLTLGGLHLVLAVLMTPSERQVRPREPLAVHQLLRRHFPARLLVVALMMGCVFSVTTVFLTRYATSLNLSGIRTFFTAYAIAAFLIRILARNWSRTTGRHRLIVLGLAGHATGNFLLAFVTQDWQFIPAALCLGFGHALLFPCIVSLGAGAFPDEARGTGTTITLAAIDLGTILSAPMIGWAIDHFGFHSMLFGVSASYVIAVAFYAAVTWRIVDNELEEEPPTAAQPAPMIAQASDVATASQVARSDKLSPLRPKRINGQAVPAAVHCHRDRA